MKKAKKGTAKSKKVKAVNLKRGKAEVSGQSLDPCARACNLSCSCLCGVRG
jgi:hypothetical protein